MSYRARVALAVALAAAAGAAALARTASAAPGSSVTPSPTATFATPGQKTVQLTACNYWGCTTSTQTLTVLDPRPAVTGAAVLPSATAEAGQVLRFVGAGGTGLTPFTFSWQVFAAGAPATPLSTLTGASPFFDSTGLAPGSYTAVLQIQNSAGITLSTPVPFTLTAGKATSFFTVAPCRIVDTRTGAPLANSGPALLVNVVSAACGIPANARAVAANVTAVASGGAGILALYPGNYPPPPTITVSFATGETRANSAVLALATDGTGTVAALATTSGGSVDLVLDVSGYFAEVN